MTRIIGVADADPFDSGTWSGSSRYIFTALQEMGVLENTVSARPGWLRLKWLQAKCFSPNRAQWQFKHYLDSGFIRAMSQTAQSRIDLSQQGCDTILQIGAWYDLTDPARVNVSYHDGNLATRLANPWGYPPISRARIDHALQFEKGLYSRLDIIFTMSRWLADSFVNDFGVSSKKIHPIGAGINLPRVYPTTEREYDGKTILMIGREFERKGGLDLLAAFTIVKEKIPEARLKIVGPELKNLPEGVECFGYLSKDRNEDLELLLALYLEATVFVMPSLYEPFGIPFLEAMAHRLPCIGTNICAIPEIIDDGLSGYTIPPGRPDSLAEKLLAIMQDPDRNRSFGEAGYKKYKREYRWEKVAEKMVAAIDQFLSDHQA